MAIREVLTSSSLTIKISIGVDSKGNTVYKSKSFSNIKPTANIDNVYAVANALSDVLVNGTQNYSLRENSTIENI